MSLGYTRDSLADLQKYYNTSKEIDDDYLSKPPAATTTSSHSSSHDGMGMGLDIEDDDNNNDDNEDDDFLFFDGEEEHEEMINTSPSVVDLMKLNGNSNGISNGNSISDNKSKPLHLPNSNIVIHKPLSRVTSTTAKAQTETKTKTKTTIPSPKVKATTATTTTTTTTKANTTKANTNTKTIKTTNDAANNYYAGFEYNNNYDQYDNYDSYYMDPYGIDQAGSFEKSNTTTHPKRNLFCCLFPYSSTTTATAAAAAVASSNDATTVTATDDDDEDGNNDRIKNDTVVTDSNNDMEDDDDDDAGLDSDMSIGESHHGLVGDDLLSLSASSSSSDHSFESAHEDETNTTAAVVTVTVTTDKTTPTTRTTTTNPVTKTKTKEDTDMSVSLSVSSQLRNSVSLYKEQQLRKSTDESTKEPAAVEVVSNKTNEHQTKTNEKMEQTQTSVVSSSSPPPLHDAKRIVKKVPVPLTTTTKPDVDVDVTPLKSILKRTVIKPDPIVRKISHKNTSILNTTNKGGRRSILPSYENTSIRTMSSSMDGGGNDDNGNDKDKDNNKDPQEKKKNRISFSPMARVISVMARNDMSYFTKSLIWWQRNDYDDFKKTGRIIAKAMLCGGSEIWLQTSNAWGKKQGAGMIENSRGGGVGGGIGGSSKGIDGKDAVSKQQSKGEEDINEEEKDQDVGLKWWCKFGHSRRGLEHIVTIEEGRQRQRFVNTAVRAVLDEQRRQRLTRKDTNKIAAVAMQYTSWARDLALAAGAADAEAVQSNFHSQAKCRIHHLRRNLHGRGPKPSNEMDNVVVPTATFILSANSALTAKVLDANTHAHSSLRKKRIGQDTKEEEKMHTPVNVISRKAAGFQFQSPIKVE